MSDGGRLDGKVIVITGASSGFGRGAAIEFAKRGATLVLAARREHALDETAAECERSGSSVLVALVDVAVAEEVARLAQSTVEAFGQIDIWVNNAGAAALGRFEDVPLEDHIQVIETDLMGTIYGSYHAMRQFRKQSSGTLINVASVLGKIPSPYFSTYAAAKHGVVGLSAVLRQELTENKVKGIHVCTVMPTSMDTPFFEHAANYTGHKAAPVPPVYDPERVVEAIVKLAYEPEDEVAVGTSAHVALLAHQIMPTFTEWMMGKHGHKAQMVDAPPGPITEGNLRAPADGRPN